MKLSEMQEYVFKTKIELDDEGKDYITLRELNMQEMRGLDLTESDKSVEKNLTHLENIFKDCLVKHTFVKDDGEQLTNKEVYNNLKASGTLFMEIIMIWFSSLPLSKRLKKEKSDK